MPITTSHTLDVPGACLYYEVHGDGPTLVMVGHPMGASGFATVAPLLAEDHRVVCFDPRGFARSTIDDHGQDAEPDLLADDVRRLLDAVGGGPADVFGSSGGAVTGLALVAQSPEHVRTLVAHEPPLAVLLPDADEATARVEDIYRTFQDAGLAAAWQRFADFAGINMGPPGPGSTGRAPPPAAVAMGERFFDHGLRPIALYEPDLTAVGRGPARVVPAGGTASAGQFAWRTAMALAQRLGTPLAEFPGGHTGFIGDSAEFAAALRRALAPAG
jgi:pimeloyl-ACP methyl ester carboxylesterase